MAKLRIIDRDLGWGRIHKEIEASRRKPHVAVGIFGEKAAADHGGKPNVEIAATHEFGATIDHPGGTAYAIVDGRPVFISNAAAAGRDLPRTKPHTIQIPERSFIRATVDAKKKNIARLAKNLAAEVLAGTRTRKNALELLGIFVRGQMQRRIAAGIPPPLKPGTIRRKTIQGKRGTTPLIDTGQLWASIDLQARNV